MNVLIVEDDALLNESITRQVTRLGHAPAGQAFDGTQAVELACQTHPAVVLMDLQMIDPDTGREDVLAGLKATRLIQDRAPAAVIILTAHESPDLIREASRAGVSGYLVKPAADQDLGRMITIARDRFDELLELRLASRDLARHNHEMQDTLARSKRLRGLLAVCAWCKNIRDGDGDWQPIEVYVQAHSDATFTHGVCPECHHRMFPSNHPAGHS
jgi:two-component system, response regulator PdtaR